MADLFNEWDYENQQVNRWLRGGGCNQCGECCQASVSLLATEGDNGREGCKGTTWNGFWYERFPHTEPRRLVGVEAIDRNGDSCTGDRGNQCGWYDLRGFICQAWPMAPQHVEPFDNCSYSFLLLDSWPLEMTNNNE